MNILNNRVLLILTAGILCLAFAWQSSSSNQKQQSSLLAERAAYNYVIGTQTVGAKYQFTEESMLVETAKVIRSMGSNLLKFSLNPRYCTENYGLPRNENIRSLTDLATLEPSVKSVLDMDFTYYHIWAYGFSQYTQEPEGQKIDSSQVKFIGGLSDQHAELLYKEMYDLAVHLLTTYSNTGKVFYLGHWEGDWHLRWHYDRTRPVDEATLRGMIRWEQIRQKAIDDAKAQTPYEGVELYNYIEVNLVRMAMEEGMTVVTNAIIGEVNPDYVSYSSYDLTNPFRTESELREGLHKGLDYIESFLQPKEGLPPGKRVWIGEYGTPALAQGEAIQDRRSKWTIKAGLEWGAPFILYWEMYNNEIKRETGEQVGYWMIDDQGEKQAIWHTHHQFFEEAGEFVDSYYLEHGVVPSLEKFQQAALQFEALKCKAN